MKLIDIISSGAGVINNMITRSFASLSTKIKKYFNFKALTKGFVTSYTKELKESFKLMPNSKEQYVKIGNTFLAKKLLVVTFICIICMIFLLSYIGIPYLRAKLWGTELIINTQAYHEYSGEATVIDEDGQLIYKGNMENGEIVGEGILYKYNETKLYEGEFKENEYSGYGRLYDNSNLIYKGNFISNVFDGEGELYDDNGKIVYKGTFKDDLFEGRGQYYVDEKLTYDGDFVKGKPEGMGKVYVNEEKLIYSGQFYDGNYNGQGKLYHEGRDLLIYDGEFVDGLYHGQGKLYHESGKFLIYEGEFADGLYHGQGKLYTEDGVNVVYEGEFVYGKYYGQGKLYYEDGGRIQYEGEFQSGLKSGQGICYDQYGNTLYNGILHNNEIDYIPYINKEVKDVESAFGKEDDLVMEEDNFICFYNKLKVGFVYNIATESMDPVVQKILFLGEQEVLGYYNHLKLEEVEEKFNGNGLEIYYDVEGEIKSILTHIMQENIEIAKSKELFSTKIVLEPYYIRYYFTDKSSENIYFEVGSI